MLLDRLDEKIAWLGHAGFRIRAARKTIYIDPYRAPAGPPADLILITHDHFDHFSPEDVERLTGDDTRFIGPPSVVERLHGKVTSVSPGDTIELNGLDITAIAAYNTNKVSSEGRPFHPREAGWVGYLINAGGERVYHSGDTDVIPEMDQAAGVEVALLPVSGTYVMTATEAAEAARRIEPRVAIPMHWGTVVGSRDDAEEFARRAATQVHIPDKEDEGDG